MLLRKNLLSGKRNYLLGVMALLFISAICVAFTKEDSAGFDSARREVLLRSIGHELLLHSGDSTSRVLPVKKIAENEYEISFENELTFEPDFLMDTSRRVLAKDAFAGDYIINVMNCADSSVAYGFGLSKNKKDDVLACSGRKQPAACYRINIKFKPSGVNTLKNGYVLGSIPVLALVGFIFLRYGKKRKVLPEIQHTDGFTLGSVFFDAKNRKLATNENTIGLTATETRVLLIFALSPNEIIERSRLQKEIWEDEGVIVGRSLDMFISKLRKKLELDPNIKINVIRGKGYKLEISAQ